MNGLEWMRAIDWRTSSSTSVKVSIPQSEWWTRMISFVPNKRWEMTSDLMTSSATVPPALRMTWASPSLRPSSPYTFRRASIQATTATCLAGGMGRSPLSKASAYRSLLRNSSSVTLIGISLAVPSSQFVGDRPGLVLGERAHRLRPDVTARTGSECEFGDRAIIGRVGDRDGVVLFHRQVVTDELGTELLACSLRLFQAVRQVLERRDTLVGVVDQRHVGRHDCLLGRGGCLPPRARRPGSGGRHHCGSRASSMRSPGTPSKGT